MVPSFSSSSLTTGDRPEVLDTDHSPSTEHPIHQHNPTHRPGPKPTTPEVGSSRPYNMASPVGLHQTGSHEFSPISPTTPEQSSRGPMATDPDNPDPINFDEIEIENFIANWPEDFVHMPDEDDLSPHSKFAETNPQLHDNHVFDTNLLGAADYAPSAADPFVDDDNWHNNQYTGNVLYQPEPSDMLPNQFGLVAVPGTGEQLMSAFVEPAWQSHVPVDQSDQYGTHFVGQPAAGSYIREPQYVYPEGNAQFPQIIEPTSYQQPYYEPQHYIPGLGVSRNAFESTDRAYNPTDMYGQMPHTPQQMPKNRNKRRRSSSHSPPRREKRARIDSRFEDPSDSEEEQPFRKVRTRRSKKQKRRASDQSPDLTKSPEVDLSKAIVKHTGELPKKQDIRPWLRINSNTKGETTRTARINQENSKDLGYEQSELPNGNKWRSDHYTFEYYHNLDAHMFKKPTMPAKQIDEYIKQYPSDDLIIWIQIMPADSGRRYSSETHGKCLFQECLKRQWGENGTITVGHYQVAFDEKTKSSGGKTNPYDCTAWAHLDCMERFLDFEEICAIADVKVDLRHTLPRESITARWSFSGKVNEGNTARRFIQLAQSPNTISVRDSPEFENYPTHHVVNGQILPKNHEKTLAYKMMEASIERRAKSQKKQFYSRDLTPGKFIIHMNDLNIDMAERQIMKMPEYREYMHQEGLTYKKHVPREKWHEWYDLVDPAITRRIRYWDAEMMRLFPEGTEDTKKKPKASKPAPKQSKKGGKKRARDESEDSSDEEVEVFTADAEGDTDDEILPRQISPLKGTRSSSRKKQKVDYTEHNQEMDSLLDQQTQAKVNEILNPAIQALKHYNKYPTGTSNLPPAPTSDPSSLAHFTRSHAAQNPNPTTQPLGLAYIAAVDLEFNETMRGPLTSRSTNLEALFDAPPTPGRRNSTGLHLPNTPGAGNWSSPYQTRRRSSAMSNGSRGRQASFNAQPVSASAEYDVDEPPSALGTPERRRSSRIAGGYR